MKYVNILSCYKSGQITEKQWEEHMKDDVFRKWAEKLKPPRMATDMRVKL